MAGRLYEYYKCANRLCAAKIRICTNSNVHLVVSVTVATNPTTTRLVFDLRSDDKEPGS
jgi:hypothetical protein